MSMITIDIMGDDEDEALELERLEAEFAAKKRAHEEQLEREEILRRTPEPQLQIVPI